MGGKDGTKQGKLTEARDFERIGECGEALLKTALAGLAKEDIVKASMGASPQVNELLKELLPEIGLDREQSLTGRVRVEEVEAAQERILSRINEALRQDA